MAKNPILEILKLKYQILKNDFTEFEAYNKILDEIKTDELLQGISQKEIDNIIAKPKQLYSSDQQEIPENEDGDTYGDEYSEVSNNGAFLDQIPNFGWLEKASDREKLLQSAIYNDQVRKKMGSMPDFVKKEIDTHSLTFLVGAMNREIGELITSRVLSMVWYKVERPQV